MLLINPGGLDPNNDVRSFLNVKGGDHCVDAIYQIGVQNIKSSSISGGFRRRHTHVAQADR